MPRIHLLRHLPYSSLNSSRWLRSSLPHHPSYEAGANLFAVQETGDTPLSLAAYFGLPRAVSELVRRGADVECRDREGLAPGEAFEQGVDAAVRRRIQVRWTCLVSFARSCYRMCCTDFSVALLSDQSILQVRCRPV